MRVLVIDDDPALVRLVSATLRDGGFIVSAAGNGVEGLQRVEEDAPDAIVLDLNMPLMDGPTFFKELRGRGVNTPVLVLSAHGARDVRRAIGADAAMEKPFDPDALVVRVRLLIDHDSDGVEA